MYAIPPRKRSLVIPAGFEPGITGLKILRPVQLDEGTMSARFPGGLLFRMTVHYAITRI